MVIFCSDMAASGGVGDGGGGGRKGTGLLGLRKKKRQTESPTERIRTAQRNQQRLMMASRVRLSADLYKMTPVNWWLAFQNVRDADFAWYCLKRQVQLQLLRYEFLIVNAPFTYELQCYCLSGTSPLSSFSPLTLRMTDLLTAYVKPLIALSRYQKANVKRQKRLDEKRRCPRCHREDDDDGRRRGAPDEYEDSRNKLMLIGPINKVKQRH